MASDDRIRSTTILAVRRDGKVALGGDGQVTLGATVIKGAARKIRPLAGGSVLAGFAGSAADAFALLERFERRLAEANGNLLRAAIDLTKDWRTDRALRRLESSLVVVDRERSLLLGGAGDVIEPDDGILAIGSGGPYAAAAARALLTNTAMPADAIAREALGIAADLCIYTNRSIAVETL